MNSRHPSGPVPIYNPDDYREETPVRSLDYFSASDATARELDDLLSPEDARFPATGDPLAWLGDES